ncbi:MAG: hypothetical protein K6G22_07260 [Lachnospiraceae bacterium]|nr:hypothetical protein [Lachnospiraceae bacterium]
MKVIERNKNRYVLEPLKQYLVNEGIDASVEVEWKSGRHCGPYVLVVDDESYYEALNVLNEIDRTAMYTGEGSGEHMDNPITRLRERLDLICKWFVRILLLLMVIFVVYYVVRSR